MPSSADRRVTGQSAIRVGVVGAGTMGTGIVQLVASHGHDVLLYDSVSSAPPRALGAIEHSLQVLAAKGRFDPDAVRTTLERIQCTQELSALAAADLIIEAAIEDLEVKRRIFHDLSNRAPATTLLATNTSSLPVSSIASASNHPERVLGMHFFNPAPIMDLVEIVRASASSEETLASAATFCRGLGKTPVVCADTPGFIVNRVARHFYGEALRLLAEGSCTVVEMDRIVRVSGGFRMGPFELMDLIGIDVNYAVTRSVYEQFSREPRFRPHPIQQRMVEAGTLGRKTGRGFYTYDSASRRDNP